MAADTRKEKRAPVSLKVRFKSATVDEFIEQYSVDISVGGLFIKTKSPMPIGTLLKFEFQLKDESRLIHGVGRVVWKRDENEAKGSDIPAGMGIKFIKMDADSRALVDKIVSQRGEVQSSFDMVPPEIQSSMPPPGDGSVITIRPAAPAVPQEALRSPVPSAPPAIGVPKAAQRYKSTLAFDASALPTPQSSRVPEEARPADAPPPAPFFPSTTPADEMPDEADRTNIRPASEIKAQAEAAESEAARQRAELEARMEEARNAAREHGEDEDVGRVTMPESDVRKAARAVSRPLSDDEQRAALRKAAEEEARAERRAAAQRADVSHATHAVPMIAASTVAVNEDPSTEAPTLPPGPMEMAPEIGGVYESSSHKNDLPPLDFDDHQVTPIVGVPAITNLDSSDDEEEASDGSEVGESETRSGAKKKKKKKKNKRGESMRPQETPRAVRISGAPPGDAPLASSSTAIEKASEVRKGPRLSPTDSLSAKKAKSTSKTLPMVLSVVALAVAIGVYAWSSQSAPAPAPLAPPSEISAEPTPTPAPSAPAVPSTDVPAPPTPAPTETPVAVATAPVRVESVPSGASIRFADADHGVTPATLELPQGVATSVTVTAPGFMPLTQEITARTGIAPVRFALAPMPYTVMVTTVPEGARVTANGRNVIAPGALTLGRVTQPVLVTATKVGFDAASQTISVGDFIAENGQMVARLTLMLPPHVAPQASPSRPAPSRREPAITGNPPAPAPSETENVPPARPEPEAAPARPEPETPPPPRPEPERPAPSGDEPLPDNPF